MTWEDGWPWDCLFLRSPWNLRWKLYGSFHLEVHICAQDANPTLLFLVIALIGNQDTVIKATLLKNWICSNRWEPMELSPSPPPIYNQFKGILNYQGSQIHLPLESLVFAVFLWNCNSLDPKAGRGSELIFFSFFHKKSALSLREWLTCWNKAWMSRQERRKWDSLNNELPEIISIPPPFFPHQREPVSIRGTMRDYLWINRAGVGVFWRLPRRQESLWPQ